MARTPAKWQYGDSWERFPIIEGEVWSHDASGSKVTVHDLREGPPGYMLRTEMVYCDPPWSLGNANAFITKAGMDSYLRGFDEFMDALFKCIEAISPVVCYLEIGRQHERDFAERLGVLFPSVQEWQITYYRRQPCFLLRGGRTPVSRDFSGLDDEDTPFAAIEAEGPGSVADPCTGRGLTLLAAHKHGTRFLGSELNRRRLAVALDRAAQMGIHYVKAEAYHA